MDRNSKHIEAQLSRSVFVLSPSSSHLLPAELTRGALQLDFFFSFCLLLFSQNFRICCQMLIHARAG